MVGKARLGEILVEKGLVTEEIINEALRIKAGGERRLGHILLGMKAITDDQLKDVLSGQSGDPVCDIDTTFSDEVARVMPRYLCARLCALPLRLKENNVLEVAMADPTDYDAIIDIEHYTGKVVKANLARYSDIEQAIPQRIPLTVKEFFSPKTNSMFTKGLAAIALLLAMGLGFYTFDYVDKSLYGSKSVTSNYTLYQHHDLTVALEDTGKISLQGHGAYADGLYKISFTNVAGLGNFIAVHEKDFSDKQLKWLGWALEEVGGTAPKNLLAKN